MKQFLIGEKLMIEFAYNLLLHFQDFRILIFITCNLLVLSVVMQITAKNLLLVLKEYYNAF